MTLNLLKSLFLSCLLLPFMGRAETVKLIPDGITIDKGDAEIVLSFPVLVNAAQASATAQNPIITEKDATLNYDGGGQIKLQATDTGVIMTTSNVPDGTKFISGSAKISSKFDGGKWKTDDQEGVFPLSTSANMNVYQGNTKVLAISPPSGSEISLHVPPFTFQQLQDLRQFGTSSYFWKYFMIYSAETSSYAIRIGNGPISAIPFDSAPGVPKTAKPAARAPDTAASGTVVLKWKDGKKAVFMVAFDDSPPCDLTNVIPELEKRKLVGTFYVNPGLDPFNRLKAKWTAAAQSPYVELANHTLTHKGVNNAGELEKELHDCTQIIYECTPGKKSPRLVGFGQPGGVPWNVTPEETTAGLERNLLVNRPPFYGLPFHYKNSAELVALVDTTIASGDMGHVDFHGVGGDWLSVPTEFLTTLLDKLVTVQDQLWVTDTVSWRKYSTERQTADVKVLPAGTDEIKFALTCAADPALYDMPLTLSTKVPATWGSCMVTQGAIKTTVTSNNGFLRYDAIPGKEPVDIHPAAKL